MDIVDGVPESDVQNDPKRRRLIEAGGAVFAARGFRDATVREICATAGANLAAVNYHFGDKLGLYKAVVEDGYLHLLSQVRGEDGSRFASIDPAARPEEALRLFISDLVGRALLCEDCGEGIGSRWHSGILMREMIEPTEGGVLTEFVERFIRPQQRFAAAAVGSMLGLPPGDELVTRCVYSVVAQVLFYKHCRHVVDRLVPVDIASEEGRSRIAEHVTAFALGGIEAMRREGGRAGA